MTAQIKVGSSKPATAYLAALLAGGDGEATLLARGKAVLTAIRVAGMAENLLKRPPRQVVVGTEELQKNGRVVRVPFIRITL